MQIQTHVSVLSSTNLDPKNIFLDKKIKITNLRVFFRQNALNWSSTEVGASEEFGCECGCESITVFPFEFLRHCAPFSLFVFVV